MKKGKGYKRLITIISVFLGTALLLFGVAVGFTCYLVNSFDRAFDSLIETAYEPPSDTLPEVTTVPTTELTTLLTTELTETTKATTEAVSEATTKVPSSTKAPATTAVSDSTLIDTSRRYTYSALNSDIEKLVSRYPSLVSASNIGKSAQGRNIRLIKLGKGDKKAIAIAGLHAREHITSKYIMLCIAEYCAAYESKSGYYGSYNIKELLNEYTVYIVPCSNPDGMEIVANGKSPSASISDFSRSAYKANANGVDLNRNFPLAWERIQNGVTTPSNAYYKGKTAGSEPETKIIMELCNSNNFEFGISFHITGECIYWGDNYNTDNNYSYKKFAKELTDLTGFYLTDVSTNVSSYGGGFENWFRHKFKKPGLCVELISPGYSTSPTTNADFSRFSSTINWKVSKYILPEALT